MRNAEEFVPRNGHTAVVGIVARISGCANQKEVSLEDQIDHGKEAVREIYSGPTEYRTTSTTGKGEWLIRPELAEIEALIRTRTLDFLVVEDIGRLIRGADAVRLCGIAVDHGVRVLAPLDYIDTAEDNWEEDVLGASKENVGHNALTSKRLKKKMMLRFKRNGGATPCEISGYLKPPEAKTYQDWIRLDTVTPTICKGLRRLRECLNCSAVADFFNSEELPTGKYRRTRTRWTGDMVREFFKNPILKGQPCRGKRHTVKHNETGRRISVPNPNGPTFIDCPHLAHVGAFELDDVNALLDEKNKNRGRKPQDGVDPRLRVPRKRTRFPGQHAQCWYCGRAFVWGGNGLKNNLMCTGAREWACWNAVSINGPLIANRLVEAITRELYALSGFDEQFRAIVAAATTRDCVSIADQWAEIERKSRELEQQKQNLADSIAQYGPRPMLDAKIREIDDRERQLAYERTKLERRRDDGLELPPDVDSLRSQLEAEFKRATLDSFEFSDLMRELIPELHVYLVRLCDGGHLLPRARVRLNLAGIIPDARHVLELNELMFREFTLDLFTPPQRERIRVEAVSLVQQKFTQRQAAGMIAEKPTQPALQKALLLHEKMQELGLTDPYVLLLEPPDDYSKLRRHKNSRYEFRPAENYQRAPL